MNAQDNIFRFSDYIQNRLFVHFFTFLKFSSLSFDLWAQISDTRACRPGYKRVRTCSLR
jgi:hypothetical protein